MKTEQLRLSNEQQRASNAQTLALAQTERETKQIGLDQQKASLRQFELTASTEAQRAATLLEQQKFSLQQSRLLADTEIRKHELAVQTAEMDNKLKAVDLKLKEQGRIAGDADIDIDCEKDKSYFGVFNVIIENTSAIDVELSAAVNHKYIGKLTPPNQATPGLPSVGRPRSRDESDSLARFLSGNFGDDSVLDANLDIATVNAPPIVLTAQRSRGRIAWTNVGGHQAFSYPNTKYEGIQSAPLRWQRGGGGTKLLRPGDQSLFQENFVVSAPAGTWLAIVHSVSIDGATGGDGLFHYTRWIRLPECKEESANLHTNPTATKK